jgi:glycerophosphoryl diester phosphodiesterase
MVAALAIPGCDGLEFDVRGSRDGVPVLLHDATLARVQGVPEAVDSLDAADLGQHGVPTLAEVIAVVGPTPFLDVELKGSPVSAVIDVLETGRGRTDADGRSTLTRAVVSSFEPAALAWLGEQRPGWARWLNALSLAPAAVAMAVELGCVGIAASWRGIDAAGVARAGAAGLDVAAWTVRRRDTYRRLRRLGVIAICAEAGALDG